MSKKQRLTKTTRVRAFSLSGEAVDLGPSIRAVQIEGDVPVLVDGVMLRQRMVLREPTAVEGEWRDPADENPNRREAKRVRGRQSSDPLRTMHKRGSLITLRHLKAARTFAEDFEIGDSGARPGSEKSPTRIAFSAGAIPHERRLLALGRLREVYWVIGKMGSALLIHVTVGSDSGAGPGDVASWARRTHIDAGIVTGMLVATLDRLVEHYAIGEVRDE